MGGGHGIANHLEKVLPAEAVGLESPQQLASALLLPVLCTTTSRTSLLLVRLLALWLLGLAGRTVFTPTTGCHASDIPMAKCSGLRKMAMHSVTGSRGHSRGGTGQATGRIGEW